MRTLLFTAIALLTLTVAACSDAGEEAGSPTPPPQTPSVDLSRLSPDVQAAIQDANWYNEGAPTAPGNNLIEVLHSTSPLWSDADSLALLTAYPDGLPDATLNTARTYARMTLNSLDEVILDPWLADGVDDYENAILTEAGRRTISVVALRRALHDGFFRETYETNPELLTSVRIDAIGSLSPHILERLEAEDWFSDGIDSYEASLLGILNTLLTVDEQLEVLETTNYRELPLTEGSIAVVYVGDDLERIDRVHEIAMAWMPQIEAFVGEFRPVGLVIDTRVEEGAEACHTGDGGGTLPGRIALPAEFCLQAPVIIHELAHAFIGGRYPTWFAEGVAELVAFHLTGTRAGYEGGEGIIDVEGRHLLLSSEYRNQAALGAGFLEALIGLVGDEATSAFLADVSGRTLGGDDLLARIRQIDSGGTQELENLIADWFGLTLASP